jgi:hypothetical protein
MIEGGSIGNGQGLRLEDFKPATFLERHRATGVSWVQMGQAL